MEVDIVEGHIVEDRFVVVAYRFVVEEHSFVGERRGEHKLVVLCGGEQLFGRVA